MERGLVKNVTKSLYLLRFSHFMDNHSSDHCKLLVHFQSPEKVNSDNFTSFLTAFI